ncbi:MAG: hypothetical protein DMF76_13305 [Acidobacteria bacterium]|nr:MAG: hypothetical protein DMF76_13305 [Acidobacteriota bacterium]
MEGAHMSRRIGLLGVVAMFVAARSELARAQVSSGSQDVQIYAGELFGDRLTDTPLSGRTPRLDDSVTFGGRYTYYFTNLWGVQLSAGYSPSRAGHAPGGTDDLGLTTVDLDVLLNFTPGYRVAGHPFIGYTVLGVGYAWANLDHSALAIAGTTPVTLADTNGCTANIGLGAKYYLRDNVFIDFDTRYRYLSKLVSDHGQGLNTAETTLSIGYQF